MSQKPFYGTLHPSKVFTFFGILLIQLDIQQLTLSLLYSPNTTQGTSPRRSRLKNHKRDQKFQKEVKTLEEWRAPEEPLSASDLVALSSGDLPYRSHHHTIPDCPYTAFLPISVGCQFDRFKFF